MSPKRSNAGNSPKTTSNGHNCRVNSPPRLYVLLARNAPLGVIFRRGPSDQVLLIKWNVDQDTFEFGQWLKGRVYERRCDLSPDGEILLYFAANINREFGSWTAVSRPPYFTALALWPKGGTFGGGGVFSSKTEILLDYQPWERMEVPEGYSVPKWLGIERLGRKGGWEEFDLSSPWSKRLQRDGWQLIDHPAGTKDKLGSAMRLELDPPFIWRKANPVLSEEFALQMTILGIGGEGSPPIVSEYQLIGKKGYRETIGRSEWADWSKEGHLLFAQSGCLYRLRPVRGKFGSIEESEMVADFNNLRFERVAPPEAARLWPPRRKRVPRKPGRR